MPTRKLCRLLPWFFVAFLWGAEQTPQQNAGAPGQTPPPQAPAPAQSANRTEKSNESVPQKKKDASKNRLFYVLPNFLTLEHASEAPRLTTADKFKLTARGCFDPFELLWYGALAGISQARDDEGYLGEGAKGYAERFGLRFADGTIEDFAVRAVFPSLLRQDPRYYQMGTGGFWHRLGYATSRILVTRSDAGNTQFNFSEILGSASAAAISSYTYHPRDERNVPNVMEIWVTQVSYDTLSYAIKEFWPDIQHRLHKAKSGQAQ